MSWSPKFGGTKFQALKLTLPIQEEFKERKIVVVRSTQHSGLESSSRLFVRTEAMANWQAFEDNLAKPTHLWVSGSPGTGKSTLAWAWALWKARTASKKILWLHRGGRHVSCMIDGVSEKLIILERCVIDEIPRYEADLLIVDGVTEADKDAIFNACSWWAGNNPDGWFALVSSTTVSFQQHHLHVNRVQSHVVASWVLEDYLAPCEDDEFFKSVECVLPCALTKVQPGGLDRFALMEHKGDEGFEERKRLYKEELVKAKFYFAGGSARWMFGFSFKELLHAVYDGTDAINDFSLVLRPVGPQVLDCLRGLTKIHVNGFQRNSYYFVSQFVLDVLSEQTMTTTDHQEAEFLHRAYSAAVASKSPEFQDWAFKLDIDRRLRAAAASRSSIIIDGCELPVVIWQYLQYAQDTKIPTLAARARELSAGRSFWAKPKHWRELGFDFLWVSNNDGELCLHAVAATSSASGSSLVEVPLCAVNSLAQALGKEEGVKIDRVGFSILTPRGVERPRVASVVGSLAGYKGLEGAAWEDSISSIGHLALEHPKTLREIQGLSA